MALRDELIEALEHGDDEVRPLANRLAIRKIKVYRNTLTRLADEFGLAKPVISSAILQALYIESTNDAISVISTYNRRLPAVVDKAIELGEGKTSTMLGVVEELLRDRAEKHAPVVGITSLYGPHTDAALGFFVNAGVRPMWEFGGHGDAKAVCGICQAIEDRNPHPVERVIAIGTPHHACRQEWRHAGDVVLPDGYVPGVGQPAGVVNTRTLSQRAGGLQAAIDAVLAME